MFNIATPIFSGSPVRLPFFICKFGSDSIEQRIGAGKDAIEKRRWNFGTGRYFKSRDKKPAPAGNGRVA